MATKNDPDYHKKYYEENKERLREQQREYRKKNRDRINEMKRLSDAKPENRARKSAWGAADYAAKRVMYITRSRTRREMHLRYMNEVALQYGCQNKDCKWDGELKPYQLCFHHLDPSTKETDVAKMLSWSLENIKAEINKCVVLCLNCHPLVHKGDILVNESMLCVV